MTVDSQATTDGLDVGERSDWTGLGRMVLDRTRLALSAHLVERAEQRSMGPPSAPGDELCVGDAR
ncbi:MAG: hypothetical protein ACE5GE_04385 [Phycisphaerae bacterium]